MKTIFLISCISFFSMLSLQAQIISPDLFKSIKPNKDYDNILVQKLYSNEEVSTFMIWVKKEVALHMHELHSEQVLILSGKAEMTLNGEHFMVKKGDWIVIPKGSSHSVVKVLSKKPLKVISIQAPKFEGKDRVFLSTSEAEY